MEAVVLYTVPAIGHVISMVEFGKLILASKPSLSVHILVAEPPFNSSDTAAPYIAATTPSITFHRLPQVSLSRPSNHETLVSDALSGIISGSCAVHAFVVDFFCSRMLTVAADLGIPPYLFFTPGASALSSFLYLPTLHRNFAKSFKDLGHDCVVDLPGVPLIHAADMPQPVMDRRETSYEYFLDCSANYFPRATGIIVNTFEALEPRAIKAVSDGLCIPDGPTPKVHCIGPLIHGSGDSKHECLTWLDSQPKQSVVLLCFGSLGLFSAKQLKEIAIGLERSGERFLWVVRNSPPEKKRNLAAAEMPSDPNLEELLPEGFMERTKDKGLVVKKWAPQSEVLSHGSIGGFVSHCGWNSVLESVCAGVPMVAWPLYAEQRFNRVVLVEEIKIALPMNEGPDGFVEASEVQRRVTELMASPEDGDSVRGRAIKMRDEARAALSDGGSSRFALTELTRSWKA